VSGPLASWVGEHSKATWRGRAVLKEYALASNHDGTPAADVSRSDLEHRTGHGHNTVVKGRQEVLALGELEELERPGGAGKVGSYRVRFTLCPAEARCWVCATLADLLAKTVRSADGNLSAAKAKNRPPQSKNRPPQSKNRPPQGPTTETGDGFPLQGEPSPTGDANDVRSARSPRGARSARSASIPDPAAARHELMMRADSEAEATAVAHLDDGEVVARWQSSADAASA
jgi:hypothetical protein